MSTYFYVLTNNEYMSIDFKFFTVLSKLFLTRNNSYCIDLSKKKNNNFVENMTIYNKKFTNNR